MLRPPFLVATALGAFLLFAVQPLLAKFALPWFGGAPAVWATCLLFFQALVLAGYAWASGLLARLPRRAQAGVHLALLVVALVSLPITPSAEWADGGAPGLRLLGLLAAAVGVPGLALAASAPLLQGWYARTTGRDPYPLYALSNLGSLLALAAYPFLIEPFCGRALQARIWSWTFVAYALAVAVCAILAARRAPLPVATVEALPTAAPTRGRIALWLVLPACGSALLTAVSNAICQDVAPVPFLWLLPLAIYLLSWIAAFAGPRWYPRPLVLGLLVLSALGVLAIGRFELGLPLVAQVATHAAALACGCWFLHGELARRRPDPTRLGGYYLAGAAGGALGGVAVVFGAPLVFANRSEEPLLLLAVLALVLITDGAARRRPPRWAWGLGAVAAVALVVAIDRVALVVDGVVASERTFFGVLSVREHDRDQPGRHRRELRHGGTTHGIQRRAAPRAPTSYYLSSSGVGLALAAHQRPGRRVGVVGLGCGTLATYGRAGDTFRFYELDPAVERLARGWFSFLSDSPARIEVVIGDARRTLASEADQRFDVLVLDAFSSDAVPAHLLTIEAFALWRRHLAPGGVLAVHVSNRHLDLRPVVRAGAVRLGWETVTIEDAPEEEERAWGESSTWILAGDDRTWFADPALRLRAAPVEFPPRAVVWTDDRADLFGVLK